MSNTTKSDVARASNATMDIATAVPAPAALSKKGSSSSVPLAVCVSQEFLELEGTTFFALPPAPTFRYMLSLRDGKLRVWFEDCVSKKQWCTRDLALEDYIDLNNAVPEAKASDYAVCFHELLSKIVKDSEEFPRAVKQMKGDILQLEIAMKLQFLMRTRVASYSFCLEPISVERIDILESRIRDLQGEVEALRVDTSGSQLKSELEATIAKLQEDFDGREQKLRDEILALQSHPKSPFILHTEASSVNGNYILWNKDEQSQHMNGTDGIIRNLCPGVYSVFVTTTSTPSKCLECIEVQKSSVAIRTAICCYNQDYPVSTSISCVTRIEKGDTLMVHSSLCKISLGKLTLLRVGE